MNNPDFWKTVLVHPWTFSISRNAKKFYTKRKSGDGEPEKPVKPPKKAKQGDGESEKPTRAPKKRPKAAPKPKAGAKWNV